MARERHGIQRKLTLIIVVITTLTLIGFGTFSYVSFRYEKLQELHTLSGILSERLIRSLTYPIWQFDAEFVNGILDSEMLDANVYAIVIWNDDRTLQEFSRIKDKNWDVKKKYVNTEVLKNENYIFIPRDIVYMDNKIGILELFVSKKVINEKISSELMQVLIQIFVVNSLLIIFIYFTLYRMINVPIQKLITATELIGKGNLDISIKLRSNNEFTTLGAAFNEMMIKLKRSTNELRDQERLKKEMEIAEKLQRSLLPDIPSHNDLEIVSIMKPAANIGGDYYDILYDSLGKLWFTIGDVSGRGLTPGLIMMMAETSILHTLKHDTELSPGQVACWVNKTLYENVKTRLNEEYLMSLLVLKYLGWGKFEYAGTHLDIIVYRSATGKCEQIETKGAYLAILENVEGYFENSSFTLEKDDFFVLITDGVTEARNGKGEFFDFSGLCNLIEENAHESINKIKERILQKVMRWCNFQQKDDITINIVKMK